MINENEYPFYFIFVATTTSISTTIKKINFKQTSSSILHHQIDLRANIDRNLPNEQLIFVNKLTIFQFLLTFFFPHLQPTISQITNQVFKKSIVCSFFDPLSTSINHYLCAMMTTIQYSQLSAYTYSISRMANERSEEVR